MRNLFILGLAALLALPATAAEPAAIVYSLAGEATVAAPDPRPLRLFDRLQTGTIVEVSPGSRVALAFVSGLRYELGERSRVTIGKKDLASRAGTVKALPRVSPLPRLLPIAAEDRPGPKAGAVRIRSEEIGGLSPDGTVTLADATVLHFQSAEGTGRHRVEIEDAHGTVVFRVDTEGSAVTVPEGILAPGVPYHWTVKSLNRPGPVRRGEAGFATLSQKAAEARERLRKAVEKLEDGDSRALLEAVDHGLGLTGVAAAGAVVESVTPASAGERAGLQPGDTILSWSCAASPPALPQASGGIVRFPYDLLPLDVEESPRRAVTLRGTRGGQEMTWTLTAGEWGLEARPLLSADLAPLYLDGKRQIEAGDLTAAERNWRSAALSARAAGEGRLAAWFLDRLAMALAEAGKWPEADAAAREAVAALEREAEPRAAAQILRRWAISLQRRNAWDASVERLQEALEFDRRSVSKSLAEARTLNSMGVTAARRGDYSAAEELLLQALAIKEELAPGTAEVTGSLNNLGTLARRRGDLARAEEYLTRGEELQRRLAPETADHALLLQNHGNLAYDRSDLEKSES
ncbi:MAG TPA: tetratricopeptide repeat protein, partial [Thermoanaerobaculia bacterium]